VPFQRLVWIPALLCGLGFWRLEAAGLVKPLEGKVLVLDPGHAVKNEAGKIINAGAQASRRGVLERDVALHVADTIASLLEAQGAKVVMTRTRTNPWRYGFTSQADNRGRAILANMMRADAYIRIHCDWNRDRRFQGFTTYFYRWGSRELAENIHQSLANTFPGHRDNGVKRRSFVSASAHMPAVLVELGVLSNKMEGKELSEDTHQSHLAMAVAEGITNYFAK